MTSQTAASRWNVQQNMSNEQWRDEIHEYALLIDAIANGDRSRSLKLLASYVLAKDDHEGYAEQGQLPDAEYQEDEQYGGQYQEGEDFVNQDVYGGNYQDGSGLEYDLNPDEYAEYYDDGGYQLEYEDAADVDGGYMSGGLGKEPDQNDANFEGGYLDGNPYDDGAFEGDDAYHNFGGWGTEENGMLSNDGPGTGSYMDEHGDMGAEAGTLDATGYEDEEEAADSYQNGYLENRPGTIDQLYDRSFDLHGDLSQEDHEETNWKGPHQRDLSNEDGVSDSERWDATESAHSRSEHFEPHSGITIESDRGDNLEGHGREEGDNWNQDDYADDADDWEDASVEDED